MPRNPKDNPRTQVELQTEDSGPHVKFQLELFTAFDERKRQELELMFPEIETRIVAILKGIEDHKELDQGEIEVVKTSFRELITESTLSSPELISKFTNRQVAKTLTLLLSDINAITMRDVEVALEYLQPPSFDMDEIRKHIEASMIEKRKSCVRYALKYGVYPPHAAYYDSSGWLSLLQEPKYRKNFLAAKELIAQHTGKFLDIAKPETASKMIISDLGPGDGKLTLQQIDATFDYFEYFEIEFHHLLVDESPGMLMGAITHILDKYTQYLLSLTRTPNNQAQRRKWLKPLIEALRTINKARTENKKLGFSENISFLESKLRDLFEKFLSKNTEYIEKDSLAAENKPNEEQAEKDAELIKFFVARMLSMHKFEDPKDLAHIDKTYVPLKIIPVQTTFSKLNFSKIQASSKVGVVHCIYGNTLNNEDPAQFLEEIVIKKLLNDPEVDKEGNVLAANHCILGVQVREGTDSTAFSKSQQKIMDAYDTEASRNFVSADFMNPKIVTYHDPDTNDKIDDLNEVFEIKFALENALGDPKLKTMTPRLVFKRDVIVYTGTLQTATFTEKDNEVLLLPSHKPNMWQQKEMFRNLGIQVVDSEVDTSYNTGLVHFLIRKMTQEELNEYQEILARRERNQQRRESQKVLVKLPRSRGGRKTKAPMTTHRAKKRKA